MKTLKKLKKNQRTLKLSVVLATKNEEKNIGPCLKSVKNIASEIIVVDEESTDKTREIAREYGARVYKTKHEPIFHKTKQKALDRAKGGWILQLDADERVSPKLANEIKKVINMTNEQRGQRVLSDSRKRRLFKKHEELVRQREGHLGKKTGHRLGEPMARREIVAYFVPRKNIFLGRPLIHAGVYPDGVIRLIKRGKARFPAKSVHELMEIDGEVAWLFNDLEHHDSPTLRRYINRMNRYTDLNVDEMREKGVPRNLFYLFLYITYYPLKTFCNLYFRHKGFLDGIRGFLWSVLSSFHFPIAYFKYWQK